MTTCCASVALNGKPNGRRGAHQVSRQYPLRVTGPKLRPFTVQGPVRGASRSGWLQAQKKHFGSFEELIKGSDVPVLVDFYATWCGPCQMMSRALEVVAPSLRGKVKLVKIDSEKYGKLAGQYNIQGLPTLILFKNGQPVDRLEGMLPEAELTRWLQRWL